MKKERVKHGREQETLLITLYSRALECGRKHPILVDPKAVEVVSQIDYDFTRLNVPKKTRISVCLRAREMDDHVRGFLAKHKGGTVVNLGCGLDSRSLRIDAPEAHWYDIDLPDVIALRRSFFEESDRHHMLSSSVTDPGWIERIKGTQLLFVAEGLLMYLPEEEVKSLLIRLHDRFGGCELLCDVFRTLTARNVGKHPSLHKTGAQVRWGLDDVARLREWIPSIKLIEEWSFSQSDQLYKLPMAFRLAFQLAGALPVAYKAHRILALRL